jgi:hypothetical protein
MAPVAMPAVHPLLVGLVDPRTPSRPLHSDELKQALCNVTSVLPDEEVPDKWWFLLHSRQTLTHSGRLHLNIFLWGNGIDPAATRLILQPLVKVQSQKDIEGILGSLASGTYDTRWWYFSTRYQINLFLNGEVKDPLNDYTRWKMAMYEFEVHMHKHGYPTTAEAKRLRTAWSTAFRRGSGGHGSRWAGDGGG